MVPFDEFGGKLEFMSYRTKEFFNRVLDCNHNLIISNAVIEEVCSITKLKKNDISRLINGFEDKIKIYGLFGGSIFPSAANSFNFSPVIFFYFILFYILGFFLFDYFTTDTPFIWWQFAMLLSVSIVTGVIAYVLIRIGYEQVEE